MKKILLPAILLVGGLLVGVGGIVAAAQVTGGALIIGKTPEAATAKKAEHASGIAYPLKERVVNLADSGALRYLKTTIVLEMEDPTPNGGSPKGEEYKKRQEEVAKEIRGQAAIIDDQVTQILSSKTAAELMSANGKQKLKEELKERLNKALGGEKVMAVYLTDFVIQ